MRFAHTNGAEVGELAIETRELAGHLSFLGQSHPGNDAAGLVFRGQGSINLHRQIEQTALNSVVAGDSTGVVALPDDVLTLRQLAERSPDMRLGVGHIVSTKTIHLSLARATDALAFTQAGSALACAVSYHELGSLALLIKLSSAELETLPSIDVVASINESTMGRIELESVEAVCRTGTLRSAAEVLHIHHSSVAQRIRHVEGDLGYRLRGTIPLTTAYTAILGLRLLTTRDPELSGWV